MLSKTQNSIKKLTLILSLLIGFAASSTLFAQENMQVLNETSMRDLMDANKYSGKPTYENIFSKLVITTNTIKISKNDSAQIVKSILNLSDVISCEYHPSKYSLVVKSKKQDNVYKVIDVKGVLVPYKLIINFNEETIYTIKK